MSARSALRPPKSPGRRPSGCMPPPRDQARPTVRWARSHCALPSTSAASQCRGATRSTGSAGPRGRYRRAPRARLLRPRRPAQGASRCYSPRRRLLRRRCLKKMSSGQRKWSRRASMCSTHTHTRELYAQRQCGAQPSQRMAAEELAEGGLDVWKRAAHQPMLPRSMRSMTALRGGCERLRGGHTHQHGKGDIARAQARLTRAGSSGGVHVASVCSRSGGTSARDKRKRHGKPAGIGGVRTGGSPRTPKDLFTACLHAPVVPRRPPAAPASSTRVVRKARA